MRIAPGAVVAAAACLIAGCGTSAHDQVKAKVEQLADAAAGHDYRTICDEVLAPALITRLADAGVGCEQAMRIAFGSLQNPTLSIGRIEISGRSAQAITLTAAKGQAASLDAIDLIKTAVGWRVASLGSPAPSQGGK